MSTATLARREVKQVTPGSTDRDAGPPVEEVIQTSFRLPRSKWARLRQLSIDERLSVQAIIVAALESEFERRGRKF